MINENKAKRQTALVTGANSGIREGMVNMVIDGDIKVFEGFSTIGKQAKNPNAVKFALFLYN